jgi:hypothetical protein
LIFCDLFFISFLTLFFSPFFFLNSIIISPSRSLLKYLFYIDMLD